jgi:hypothetical protein
VCVCELKTGSHSTAALMQARPRGARLHDYWQQASKRGAAKEVRFPGFRPDGDGERRADHGGEREMRRRWCVKKEVVCSV